MNHLRLSNGTVVFCLAAISMLGGCHKKIAVAPPPPPPPVAAPAPTPTAVISVSPTAIDPGQSATLSWSTTNASGASISGVGTVETSGSQRVSPSSSTDYTLSVRGAGGSVQSTARLTVNPAKPAPVASATDEELFNQKVKDAFFGYDSYAMRPDDASVAQQDAAFLAQHPGMKVLVAGHCDERGSEEYNIALGQNRAEALKNALVSEGVPDSRIRVISYGKEKPFCTDSNEQCWQQNRRDHLTLDR